MPSTSNFCYVLGCGSEAILLSLKQNLMQIHCSLTSVILVGRYDHKTALTGRHKNAQERHIITAESCLAEWLIKGTARDTYQPTTVLQAVFMQHSNFGDLVAPCICVLCTVLVLPGADTEAVPQMRLCLLKLLTLLLNKPQNSEYGVVCPVNVLMLQVMTNNKHNGTGMKRVLEEYSYKFMSRNETIITLLYIIHMYTCTYMQGLHG
jgi:hypothetical protein